MKAKKNINMEWVVTEGQERYDEQEMAQATPRVLDGSRDHGYWMEYVGYGVIDGVPVKAVYLLDYDQEDIEEEDNYDWDAALANGRLEVMVDDLSGDDYETLIRTGDLKIINSSAAE